jgi:hypothetical protein
MDKFRQKIEKNSPAPTSQAAQDSARLRDAFHQSLDFSVIDSWLKNLLPQKSDAIYAQSYASGSHNLCFHLRRPGFPMDLAIKIPLSALGQKGAQSVPAKLGALKRVNSPSLVPPIHELKQNDIAITVMPFGTHDAKAAHAHWQPLQPWIDELHKQLAQQALLLDDVVQIRCWQGIPFVIDFSDLKQSF